jgi:hypothetical protein
MGLTAEMTRTKLTTSQCSPTQDARPGDGQSIVGDRNAPFGHEWLRRVQGLSLTTFRLKHAADEVTAVPAIYLSLPLSFNSCRWWSTA